MGGDYFSTLQGSPFLSHSKLLLRFFGLFIFYDAKLSYFFITCKKIPEKDL